MVLDVYIIKFKRLKIKELSAPLGNNPRKAKEGNYKDKNRNYKTEHKNARKGRPHRTLPLVETVGLTGVRESEDRAAPAGPDGRAPTSEMLRRGTRPRKPHDSPGMAMGLRGASSPAATSRSQPQDACRKPPGGRRRCKLTPSRRKGKRGPPSPATCSWVQGGMWGHRTGSQEPRANAIARGRPGWGQRGRSPGSRLTGLAASTAGCWGHMSCNPVCVTVRTGSTRGDADVLGLAGGARQPLALETVPFRSETTQRSCRHRRLLWATPSRSLRRRAKRRREAKREGRMGRRTTSLWLIHPQREPQGQGEPRELAASSGSELEVDSQVTESHGQLPPCGPAADETAGLSQR